MAVNGRMQFGTLVPHFGKHVTRDRIIRMSRRAEELGLDSVWVRDHLLWRPHGMEGTDVTFVEPFTCLAAIGAVTSRITLGTGVVIPVRWPLKLAQNFASLSYLAGGRVIAGIGLGANKQELAAAGLDVDQRKEIYTDTIAILRKIWSEDHVSFEGKVFRFEDITIGPKPIAHIPILYGGTSRAAVRRAVESADGWYCGRLPLATLDDRLDYMHRLEEQHGKKMEVIIQPIISINRSRARARKRIDVDAMAHSSEGASQWILPPKGGFETIEDLEGLVCVGTPDEVAEEIHKLHKRGVSHVVFDLRLQFEEYEEALELLAKEVIPNFS